MSKLSNQAAIYPLDSQSIDALSKFVSTALLETGATSKDIARCRMSVEEILNIWSDRLGAESKCKFSCGTRVGRQYIRLSVTGERVNPQESEDELYSEALGKQNLLSNIGLSTVYDYNDGINSITITPPRKRVNQLLLVVIALIISIGFGLTLKTISPDLCLVISEKALSPLFGAMMNLLSAIAGPMIFLAVCSGIYGIGDLALFGRVSKKLLLRYTLKTYLILIFALVCVIWFFPIGSGSQGSVSDSWEQVYRMILNIIPHDIAIPFLNGNAMQIIFLAIMVGMGVLILGRKVSALAEIVGQIHSIVRLLMEAISQLVPIFVFLCVFNIIISDSAMDFVSLGKQLLLFVCVMLMVILVYIGTLSVKWRIPFPRLFKKFIPTFIIALSTASSAAAFGTNVETCEKRLGINDKLVNFGVPLGQVLFMPAAAVTFMISAMCVGELNGISITPTWLLINLTVSGILAIAIPPIPGGALSCYTILFTQLGIPTTGVALAISIDILMDAISTASDILCLQCELTLAADKLDMLDEKKLVE